MWYNCILIRYHYRWYLNVNCIIKRRLVIGWPFHAPTCKRKMSTLMWHLYKLAYNVLVNLWVRRSTAKITWGIGRSTCHLLGRHAWLSGHSAQIGVCCLWARRPLLYWEGPPGLAPERGTAGRRQYCWLWVPVSNPPGEYLSKRYPADQCSGDIPVSRILPWEAHVGSLAPPWSWRRTGPFYKNPHLGILST